MSAAADAQSAFFQRMTGLGFAIMSLGYAKCGVSKDAWIKQTMLFHVVSTPIFFLQCCSDDGTSFTPWVWYRAAAASRRGAFISFRGRAIDATLSRYLRQHNLTHWLISTQVLTWKIIVCLIQASFETPHLA